MDDNKELKTPIIQRYSKPYLFQQFNLSRIKIKKKKSFQEVYHSDDEYSSGNYMKRKLNQIDHLRNSKTNRHSRSMETNLIKSDYEAKSDKFINQNGSSCLVNKSGVKRKGNQIGRSRDDSSTLSEIPIREKSIPIDVRDEVKYGHRSELNDDKSSMSIAKKPGKQYKEPAVDESNLSRENDVIKVNSLGSSSKNYTLPMRRFLFQKISKVPKSKRKSINHLEETIFIAKGQSIEEEEELNELKCKLRHQKSLLSKVSNDEQIVNRETTEQYDEGNYNDRNNELESNLNESNDQLHNRMVEYEIETVDEKLISNEFDEAECLVNSLIEDQYDFESVWKFEEELNRSKAQSIQDCKAIFLTEEHEKTSPDYEEREFREEYRNSNSRSNEEEADYEIEEQNSIAENPCQRDKNHLRNSIFNQIEYQNSHSNSRQCLSHHHFNSNHHQKHEKKSPHNCQWNSPNMYSIDHSKGHSTGQYPYHATMYAMNNSTHNNSAYHHSNCLADHDNMNVYEVKKNHKKHDKQRSHVHRMKFAMNQPFYAHETGPPINSLFLNSHSNKSTHRNFADSLAMSNSEVRFDCPDKCVSKYDKFNVLEPTIQSPDCSTYSIEPVHYRDDRLLNNESYYCHNDHSRYAARNSDCADYGLYNHSVNHSKQENHRIDHLTNHSVNCNQFCCSGQNSTYYDPYICESNGYSDHFSTHLLESELSVLKDQIEAQQARIKEYEVKVSELQAQLLITENSYQEILKQKFRIEDEKNSLINELSRIKTIKDDKIRLMENEISFFKKTLLERETEIASLRLYLAKLVRASNHLITENDSVISLSRSSDSLSKKNIEKVKRVSDKPPIAPRNYFNNQSQFKDSSLTGSFTMPSATNSSKLTNNHTTIDHTKTNTLQSRFTIKSSTPVLNERCLSPINRLDLATSREQLEVFCKQRDNPYDEIKPHFNQFNYSQFVNQSPNSTCSTPNRSAKSSSSTSANNSLLKSGNYLDKLFNNNFYTMQFKPSLVSKSNDNLSLSDQTSLLYFNRLNESSNFSSGSNFNSNASSFLANNHLLQPSQTNSFTSLSMSSNSSSMFGGSIRDIVRSRPVSFSFSSNVSSQKENRNILAGRNPFVWFRRASRSSSAPELADDSKLAYFPANKNSNPDLAKRTNRKGSEMITSKDKSKGGFKWFFEKMKNNKTQLSHSGLSFSRSSLRATIGPLSPTRVDVNQKFNQWDSTILADWFSSIGLGNYSESVLRSMINGEQLASASDIQLEKLLQLRNHFHRKKLRLAIQTANRSADEQTMKASKLDYVCVAKWLDDIGLPQYKEIFLENRIDGAVLHHLTVDDLLRLKINTQLHHSSIRTGIFVLRANSFNLNCLKRRASPTSNNKSNDESDSFNMPSLESNIYSYDPGDVCLWTCHRLYEWLKSIDLAEYIANLRGSGVNGALIILDDTFNANGLATLLSIPLNKTLLRRHISNYFIQLVGFDIGQRKHLHLDKTGCSLISAKVKIPKKSNFRNSFRKKKYEEYAEEYVCPMAANYLQQDTFNANFNGNSPYHSSSNSFIANQIRTRFGVKPKNFSENIDGSANNETNNSENLNKKDH